MSSEDSEFPKCSDRPYLYITLPSLGFGAVTLLCIIVSTVYFFRSYFQAKASRDGTKKSPVSSRVLTIVIFTIISLILTHITMVLTMVFCFFGDEETIALLSSIHAASWLAASMLILWLFILRLEKVFDGTPMAYSRLTFIKLYSIFFSCIGIGLLSVVFFYFNATVGFISGMLTLIIYIILALVTLYLFIRGLFTVAFKLREYQLNTRTHAKNKLKKISNQQLELIDTMCKYVVIVSSSLVTTFLIIFVLTIRSYFYSQNNYHINILMYFVHFNCMMIDAMTNTLCLMAQFHFFASKQYYYLCNCLHQKCKTCVKKQAVRSMHPSIELPSIATSAHSTVDSVLGGYVNNNERLDNSGGSPRALSSSHGNSAPESPATSSRDHSSLKMFG